MKTISGQLLKSMFISAANNLFNHYPEIDALNVFPVPDGDTGMNMNLTMTSGAKEIYNKNEEDVYSIAKAFSRGLLMGARGNSGVITSQIFRGFAKALEGKEEITPYELAEALLAGKEASYRAVMRPVEGTILTVIRETSDALYQQGEDEMSVEECFEIILKEARESLERTPELLPVLKEVGVVDSGGAGLVTIFEGMQKALLGEFVEKSTEGQTIVAEKETKLEKGYQMTLSFLLIKDGTKKHFIEKHFKDFGMHHGYNLSYTTEKDDRMNIKVQTLHPGTILAYLQQFGEFENIAILPLKPGSEEKIDPNSPKKKNAIIAVSAGAGLDELFKQVGVDVIVSGGQTMNPSIQDFTNAIKKANAHNVFILPNNSNIVMAANQACEMIEDDTDARVIPSKTIPQGLVSALVFSATSNVNVNFNNMKAALKNVSSGQVTFSVKDTDIEGIHVTKDYYMGLRDKNIVTCVKDKFEALRNLLSDMIKKDSTLVTVICGEDILDNEIADIQKDLENNYKGVQINVVSGKQPVYSFIVGVE
ncbi:MAG: DAK2 domain-containing protein [Bacilli bacterium]|nr:DAK2 domain-containing protein [Bacilli bacterium]